MAIIKHRFWTLARNGDLCFLNQYETTTELRGDEAWHRGCEKIQSTIVPTATLGASMVHYDITEFTDEENATWLLQQPKDS
jgi:hypothetical protein